MKTTRIARALLALTLCATVPFMAACAGDPVASATSKIDELPHIGDGRKIEYHRMLEAEDAKAPEAAELLYRRAKAENDLVGRELRWAGKYGEVEGKGPGAATFNEDGTVSGDKEVLEWFGTPTHWQKGVSKFRMCWSAECEYYSSWTVMPSMTTQGIQYQLYLEGLGEEDSPITLSFKSAYPEGDEPLTYQAPEYTPKVYSDEEDAPQS